MRAGLLRRPVLVRGGALVVLAACITAVTLLQLNVVDTPRGQRLDQELLQRVVSLVGDRPDAAHALLALTTELSVLAVLAVLVVVALARRRPVLAAGAVVIVLGSSATTSGLKLVLGGSLPSGHATAVAGLAGAAVLVAPRAARSALALLGVTAIIVEGTATMIAGWHRPVDLLAACLVVVGWMALAAALAPRGATARR